MEFNYEMLEQQEAANNQAPEGENKVNDNVQFTQKSTEQSKQDTKKKEALTPERLAELRKIAPEINWGADTVATEGEAGMADAVDVISFTLEFRKK